MLVEHFLGLIEHFWGKTGTESPFLILDTNMHLLTTACLLTCAFSCRCPLIDYFK